MPKSNKPIKSNDRDESGEYYWICPKCGNRVGGYIITGRSFNDWSYEERIIFVANAVQKLIGVN